jgi:hypothetical protein
MCHEILFFHQPLQNVKTSWAWWLKTIILATWEAEIRRIVVQASLGKSL